MRRGARSVIALAVATASAARAQTPTVVRVFVAGSPEAVSGTRDALRDRCARANLNVIVEDAASVAGAGTAADTWALGAAEATPAEPAESDDDPSTTDANTASQEAVALRAGQVTDLAVGYVEIVPEAGSRVVMVDGRTQGELERRSLGPAPSLEMSIETVAHVICATIDSTLATRTAPAPVPNPLPTPLPPPHPLVPVPKPAATSESTFLGWAGLFGTGTDYGAGFRGGGGGLFGATAGTQRLRASLLVTASYFPSTTLERQGAAASLGLFSARLLPAAVFRASTDIETVLGVGPGVDWLHLSPGTPPAGGTAETGVNRVEPVLSALLGARLRASEHFGFWLAAGVDLDLYRHRYVNEASGEPRLFFEAPLIRGSGQAGLAVTFGRDGVEASRAPTKAREEQGAL